MLRWRVHLNCRGFSITSLEGSRWRLRRTRLERTNTDEVTPLRNMAVFTFRQCGIRPLASSRWRSVTRSLKLLNTLPFGGHDHLLAILDLGGSFSTHREPATAATLAARQL
jgi:hypothetical protein